MTLADDITEAARIIKAGGLVGVPTETVYGLAADATNDESVARIFKAKRRPQFNPLIVHFAALEDAFDYAVFSDAALHLARSFWPGPLTLVLPRKAQSNLSLLCSAGLDTIAIRMPRHPLMRALIETAGVPLAAPSANLSGTVSPTTAAHVAASLGNCVDVILDGGACVVGVESTILKVDAGGGVTLLRPGGLGRDMIDAFLGGPVKDPAAPAGTPVIQAPGMMTSHYAPAARLRLNAAGPLKGEAWLGFGKQPEDITDAMSPALNLSPKGDLVEAAANLFAFLRALDEACSKAGIDRMAVAPIPLDGLGEAINDRLQRAAAPRDQC